jgi:hypothetical protein
VHQLACTSSPLPRLDLDHEYHPLTIHERGGHWVKQNASNKIPSRSEFTMLELEADHCRTGLTPRRAEGTGVQHPLCSTTFRLAGRGGTWGTPKAPASGQNRAELHGRLRKTEASNSPLPTSGVAMVLSLFISSVPVPSEKSRLMPSRCHP